MQSITLASPSSTIALTHEASKDIRNDGESYDRIVRVGKGFDETEGLRMESDPLSVPADYEVIKQRCSTSTVVVRSIISTPPHNSLTEDVTAEAQMKMPALPGHAASLPEVHHPDAFQPSHPAGHAEESQHLEQRAQNNAIKCHASTTPEKHDMDARSSIENHENSHRSDEKQMSTSSEPRLQRPKELWKKASVTLTSCVARLRSGR